MVNSINGVDYGNTRLWHGNLVLGYFFNFSAVTYRDSDNPSSRTIRSSDTNDTEQHSNRTQNFAYPQEELAQSNPYDPRFNLWAHWLVIEVTVGASGFMSQHSSVGGEISTHITK